MIIGFYMICCLDGFFFVHAQRTRVSLKLKILISFYSFIVLNHLLSLKSNKNIEMYYYIKFQRQFYVKPIKISYFFNT